MRRLLLLGIVGVVAAGTAHADGYPQNDIDRPIVLLPDMSLVDVGLDFPSYRFAGQSSITPLGKYAFLDIVVDHAFGPVEAGMRLVDSIAGPFASLSGGAMLGPGALVFSAGIRAPRTSTGLDHEYAEDIGYHVKGLVVPHVLRVDASVFINADQFAGTVLSGNPVQGTAGIGSTVEVVDRLSFGIGGSVAVPIADTSIQHVSFGAGAELKYVVDRFDFYGELSGFDLTRAPRPYAGVGIIARFGG